MYISFFPIVLSLKISDLLPGAKMSEGRVGVGIDRGRSLCPGPGGGSVFTEPGEPASVLLLLGGGLSLSLE